MKLSFLQRLALFARHRYRLIFVVSALAGGLSPSLLTLRLTFDTDILNLLPRNEPAVRAYVETLRGLRQQHLAAGRHRIPEGARAGSLRDLRRRAGRPAGQAPRAEERPAPDRRSRGAAAGRSSPSRCCSSTPRGGRSWPPALGRGDPPAGRRAAAPALDSPGDGCQAARQARSPGAARGLPRPPRELPRHAAGGLDERLLPLPRPPPAAHPGRAHRAAAEDQVQRAPGEGRGRRGGRHPGGLGQDRGGRGAAEAAGRAGGSAHDRPGRRVADPLRHAGQHRHLGPGGVAPLHLRLPAARARWSTRSCR